MKPRPRSATERVALVAALAMLVAEPARAAVPPEDSALAEALFREGKRLMNAQAYAEACPKLAESQRLDPGGGTLLTLALCHEAEGRTASAWAELNEALALARNENRADRVAVAKAHADALEPKLARLTIAVSSAAAPIAGLEVKRDGKPIARPAWGVAVPVDRGEHVVEASAPGRETFRTRVTITEEGARVVVEIPPLAMTPPPPPPTALPPPPRAPLRSGPDGRAIAGYTIGVAGVAALAAGAITGARALTLQRNANAVCPTAACSDMHAVSDNNAAGTFADVSTAMFVIGGAAVVTGALLAFLPRAPRATSSLVLAPSIGRHGAAIGASGAW